MAIFGVLAAIAGPKIADTSSRIRANGVAQQLVGDLGRARTAAIKRNQAVTLSKTGPSSYTIDFLGGRTLDGATFLSGPDSVRFAPFGPPLTGAATFVLTVAGHTKSVVLNAAGYGSVQ